MQAIIQTVFIQNLKCCDYLIQHNSTFSYNINKKNNIELNINLPSWLVTTNVNLVKIIFDNQREMFVCEFYNINKKEYTLLHFDDNVFIDNLYEVFIKWTGLII